jgi:hypothetical protein
MESSKTMDGPDRLGLPAQDPSCRDGNLSEFQIDSHAEARLVRKLDSFIIPITMLLYLLSFLDRVNIGNAR